MQDERYTAKYLVNLTLSGHFCMRVEIDHAIRMIDRLSGEKGRERMNELPDLRAYPSESELDEWQKELFVLLADAKAQADVQQRERAALLERDQLKLWRP